MPPHWEVLTLLPALVTVLRLEARSGLEGWKRPPNGVTAMGQASPPRTLTAPPPGAGADRHFGHSSAGFVGKPFYLGGGGGSKVPYHWAPHRGKSRQA